MSKMSRILKPFLSIRSYHSAMAVRSDKIYELRTYNIVPQHVKEFFSLTSEQFHLRTSQSKLVGYWATELGGLNQVVHIWEYDSLEHRAQVRASLATNKEWIQNYFSKILPMLVSQENSLLAVIPGIPLSQSTDTGFYQLQTLNFRENNGLSLLRSASIIQSIEKDALIGAFYSLHGNLNQLVLLWKHAMMTDASNLIKRQHESAETWGTFSSGFSKVMIPHKVSPLQ